MVEMACEPRWCWCGGMIGEAQPRCVQGACRAEALLGDA